MVTKQSLIDARESVNEAVLQIRQKYKKAPTSKEIYFIVEGKDDIPYYASKGGEYIPDGWEIIFINAHNRKNVVDTFKSLDWTRFSKKRIAFFVDRDLSDYTGEETPISENIYITDSYSIENELCTRDTYIRTIKYYFDLADISELDEKELSHFYCTCWSEFEKIALPVMGKILLWKERGIPSNYNNFRFRNVFTIEQKGLVIKEEYRKKENLISYLSLQSGILYNEDDLDQYINTLMMFHSPEKFIRGKYILEFFVMILLFISRSSDIILPSHKKAKASTSIGYENCITTLCGIMKTPRTLIEFFKSVSEGIQSIP